MFFILRFSTPSFYCLCLLTINEQLQAEVIRCSERWKQNEKYTYNTYRFNLNIYRDDDESDNDHDGRFFGGRANPTAFQRLVKGTDF